MVLSHKGGASLAKAVEQVVAYVLQAHGGARCRHDLGAQTVDGGLDDDVGDGKDGALDAGGQADLDDALEGDGVDSQVAWGDADDGVGLEQADKEREDTLAAVKNISDIIAETAEGTKLVQSVAAKLQENVDTMNQTAQSLGDNMNDLKSEISVFKTE